MSKISCEHTSASWDGWKKSWTCHDCGATRKQGADFWDVKKPDYSGTERFFQGIMQHMQNDIDNFKQHRKDEAHAEPNTNPTTNQSLALDTNLDHARALHRVWRALNDGDCPSCHSHHPAHAMDRESIDGIACPSCGFYVTDPEIDDIETLFAPAMDAAVQIFNSWRQSRNPIHKPAPPQNNTSEISTPINHWAVSVQVNNTNILSIESNSLSGKPDLSNSELQTIRNAAQHLLSFAQLPSQPFIPE
jgi:hypothetical protein